MRPRPIIPSCIVVPFEKSVLARCADNGLSPEAARREECNHKRAKMPQENREKHAGPSPAGRRPVGFRGSGA
jgi:hypothetical protein